MSLILFLNKPQVSEGLATFTHTISTTGLYDVQVQVQVPQAIASGNGAGGMPSGNGRDLGLGMTGGSQGIGQGSNLSLGNGGLGLGSGGSVQDGASAAVAFPAVSSALVLLVKQNGTTVFTAPALSPTQSALQFKVSLLLTAADVITIVPSSANASDKVLNGLQITASIAAGA